ncbi:YqcI/YcgG family protein [Pseudomonas putida]|uniref:YqcI/YcgG family protein n=1 Tax=Pseudomonas TaxID=286 RepID=UPI0010595428|nr:MULTISPECIES: YqcI/YcgG family protein [Pseudomonas]MBF8747271.1 YqcI/YcgG family protein [Pseudomonas monteilii]MCT8164956.1 YqcI/YcgG family protein [Pseudomonas sp. HD6422]MCT8183854.1 YqcI/YcgG family protein [Pseudomonas sp. HD6421]TDJ77361.1 YqcI/YcgG family protein [Pseudomonas putida]
MFTGYGNCYRLDALELNSEHVRHCQHWTYQTIQHFRGVLANPDFPCLFGRKAVAGESCHILFARAEHLADDIARGLSDYVATIKPIPLKQRIGSPLVVFLETPGDSTLAQQQALAWKVLEGVHARDPQPWPQAMPTDPQDSDWSFCYAGMPLFINMNFPGHQQMKSRNLGPHITFVINPRENFDEVANAATESGRRIRARIRDRVRHYNDGVVPDTLGAFGDRDNYEWKQYQLQEQGSLNPSRCPFHAHATTDTVIEN